MSFDRETGDIWTGDVGANRFEEVNVIGKGGNYQWPYMEGPQVNSKVSPPEDLRGTESPPFYYYAHTGLDRAIIGGVVYRGNKHPELKGRYVFGDNFSGRISAIAIEDESTKEAETLVFSDQLNRSGITSFTETPDGDIYLTILGSPDATSSTVLRLVKADETTVSDAVDPQDEADESPEEVTLESARQVFASNCTHCHGAAGKGDGAGLEAVDVKAPDFSSPEWQRSRQDDFLIQIIQEGGASSGLSNVMPPWEGALSREEIEMLVPVRRSLESSE